MMVMHVRSKEHTGADVQGGWVAELKDLPFDICL